MEPVFYYLLSLQSVWPSVKTKFVVGKKEKPIAMPLTISCHSGTPPPRRPASSSRPAGGGTSGGRRCYLAADLI
jgi:hypothetical protein